MKIFKKTEKHFIDKKPFVVYRKPNETLVSGFFMNSTKLDFSTSLSEPGFVFAPFENSYKTIFFHEGKSEFLSEEILVSEQKMNTNLTLSIDNNAKKNHIAIVAKAVEEINNSELKKVVISRKEIVNIANFDIIDIYQKLLFKYDNAFVYVWFHPEIGLWLGATPETLLKANNFSFSTMSLAGTKKNKNEKTRDWIPKELEEQQLVTDFIENQTKPISNNLVIGSTQTIKAGRLFHLKTDFSGTLKESISIKELIQALHPTPAICGLPRDNAKQFILDNEHYQRSYYTGFLGEINLKREGTLKSSLFVNLRCMEVLKNTVEIYVGGGITKDSVPEKEWEETVSKSETMKAVL